MRLLRLVGVLFDLVDLLLSFLIVVLNGFDFFHELIGFLDTLFNELLGSSLLLFRLDELFHLLLNHLIVFFCLFHFHLLSSLIRLCFRFWLLLSSVLYGLL